MICELLFEGKENARTGKDLALYLGVDVRQITEQIERERRSGKPICATTDAKRPGYYLPATDKELAEYCASIARRATELDKTRRALVNVLDQTARK